MEKVTTNDLLGSQSEKTPSQVFVSSPKTDLETNLLSLENRNFENISFSQ